MIRRVLGRDAVAAGLVGLDDRGAVRDADVRDAVLAGVLGAVAVVVGVDDPGDGRGGRVRRRR